MPLNPGFTLDTNYTPTTVPSWSLNPTPGQMTLRQNLSSWFRMNVLPSVNRAIGNIGMGYTRTPFETQTGLSNEVVFGGILLYLLTRK